MDFFESLKTHFEKEEIDKLKESLSQERSYCLVLDESKISSELFIKMYPNLIKHPFVKNAFFYNKNEYDFGKKLEYDLGCYSIQDGSSMMVPYFLDPKDDELTLDFSAAPGGKTILASLLCDRKNLIISNDINYERARALSNNVERMGLDNIVVISNDFSRIYPDFAHFFDKIILDAPCSGSAMFRKNSNALNGWSMRKVAQCAQLQKELIYYAWSMLKPGGKLIYSTCSFSKEENEEVISSLTEKFNDVTIIDLSNSKYFKSSSLIKGAIYIVPYLFNGEGQFICLLEKIGDPYIQKRYKLSKNITNELTKKYNLDDRTNIILNNTLYSLNNYFPVSKSLKILRYGIQVSSENNYTSPLFSLSRAYRDKNKIELDENKTKLYLHGDSFQLAVENGFHIVSYKGMNLGFVKVVNGIAKNLYPKGLRREYKTIF